MTRDRLATLAALAFIVFCVVVFVMMCNAPDNIRPPHASADCAECHQWAEIE